MSQEPATSNKASTDREWHSQEKIWKHFQNAAKGSFELAWPRLDALVRKTARLVARLPGERARRPVVLNIGVGDGRFEQQAAARGWEVHSLDPDAEALARLKSAGVTTHVGIIEQLPQEDSSIDVVIASEVLEHLTDAQRRAGLAEIARVLRAGGTFLGTVPYAEDLAAGEVICPDCGLVFHRWGHHRSFQNGDISRELSPFFSSVQESRTAFVSFSRGIVGNLKSVARWLLAKLGQPIAVPSIVWQATK